MKIDNRKLDLLLARQCMSRRDLRDRNGASPQTLQRIGKGEDIKARQKKQAAAQNPERFVLAEKAERRISGQLQGLEAARAAAAYTPPAPSDAAELLQGLQKYRDAHAAKLKQVRASIAEAEAKRREIENGLHRAVEECDAALTAELTDRRRDNAAKLDALREMETRVDAIPVFPDGVLTKEWAAICKKAMPDWKTAALRVETLATEYRAACLDLLQLHDTLKDVREQLGRTTAEQDGTSPRFVPVFTVGLDAKKMIVDRADYIRIASIGAPAFGPAL